MELWLAVVLCVLCLTGGAILGVFFERLSTKHIGSLIITPFRPDVRSEIYTVLDVEVSELRSGQVITMDVIVADVRKRYSQQNQGL